MCFGYLKSRLISLYMRAKLDEVAEKSPKQQL
jgi:hypothetical protein